LNKLTLFVDMLRQVQHLKSKAKRLKDLEQVSLQEFVKMD